MLRSPMRRRRWRGCALRFRSTTALPRTSKRVIVRAAPRKAGKVGIVTGGGSGHLPVFTGYVGRGLARRLRHRRRLRLALRRADGRCDARGERRGGRAAALRQLRRRRDELRHGRRHGRDGGHPLAPRCCWPMTSPRAGQAERQKRRGVAGHGLCLQDRRRGGRGGAGPRRA